MTDDNLNVEARITIAAPPERVWRFLTSDEHVPQWLGCMRYRKGIGNVFYMQQDEAKRKADDISGATHCEILELNEPYEFVFSWYLPETPATTVRIHLEASDDGTEVALIHDGWDQFDAQAVRQIRDALANGWTSFVLPNLKRKVESGQTG